MKKISLRIRKLLALTISCCLLITSIGPLSAFAEDISGHWAIDDINFLREKGLVQGDGNGNINPDNNITRAEFIALINRTFEFIDVCESNFPDVTPGAWYYDDFAIAKNQGYIQGDDKGNANPGNLITRVEVAVALARVLELEPQSDASEFADSVSFPSWSIDSIIAMTESGFIGGYPDNTFRALNNITRAEAITIMARITRAIESEEGEVGDEVGDEETPLASQSGNKTPTGGGPGGNPDDGGNDNTRTITSFAPVVVYTSVDTAPTMPTEITAYYDDGSSGNVSVTWDAIDSSQYTTDGTFTVQGAVAETSVRPSATVTVSSDTHETPVTFQDPNFKEAVIDNLKQLPGYSDYTIDSDLYPADLANVASLDVSNRGITSMGELSYFINLKSLYCSDNNLSALDLSNNTALEGLECYFNNLATLDVSNNIALMYLCCNFNDLTTLDVGHNTVLQTLYCNYTNLTTLDLSNNTALENLVCDYTYIATLDVSNNTKLRVLSCSYTNINALDVEKNIELQALYCSGNNLTKLEHINSALLRALNCGNNKLTSLDVSTYTELRTLDCGNNNLTILNVSNNMELQHLACYDNNLTALDLSNNTALEGLSCSNNNMTTLDVSKSALLWSLDCSYNNLTAIDLSNNTSLQTLDCSNNNLTTLDVGHNTALWYLNCGTNNLATLDVSHNTELTDIRCWSNNITALDLRFNTGLRELYCHYNNLSALDLSNNKALQTLYCYNNVLTRVNASNNTSLMEIRCGSNNLTTLDINNSTALQFLECNNNNLATLDLSSNTGLRYLDCGSNNLTTLDIGTNTELRTLGCGNNNLSTLDVSNNKALLCLYCGYNNLNALNVSNNTALLELSCWNNNLTTLDVGNNTVLEYFDSGTNNLTTLDVSNNKALLYLYCGYNNLNALSVSNNTALLTLGCWNNNLTTLDVSNNTVLEFFDCGDNNLSTLDVSNNKALLYLYCYGNNLSALDVSNNTALLRLGCWYNNLSTLDVSKNSKLVQLSCYSNSLTAFNVSNNTILQHLDCDNNNLDTLNVSNNPELLYLSCWNNDLLTLDLINNLALQTLYCHNNNLNTLDVSNNTALTYLYCGGSQLNSVYFTRGSNVCSIELNGNGYFSNLVIDFDNGQIQVMALGETTPDWELSGTAIGTWNGSILSLTGDGLAKTAVNGTSLVGTFPPLPPPVKLAMVIGYNSNTEIEDGESVTKYTATIIDIDGVVHDVPTTAAMYNNGNGTRIGVVSLFEIDNSDRYTFLTPEPTDPTYNVDDGITKILKGEIPGMPPSNESTYLKGGTSVNRVNSNTIFVQVNYIDDPNDNNSRIPDGTVTIYIGRSNVQTFEPLIATTAVSHDVYGYVNDIADIVFIFDDVCPACEYSFVYIVGSWNQTADGYAVDVIVEGKWDTITVESAADRDALIAKAGQLWDNIKVDSNRQLDLTSSKQLFHDSILPPQWWRTSAGSSIRSIGGLLELDGVYSFYTADDDVPVYTITRIDTYKADVAQGIAKNLDEDGFVFAYIDTDSHDIVLAIYIIREHAERTIMSFATVNVYTNVGISPIMPTPITAYYSDGSRSSVFVTWDSIDPSQYASAGTFIVHGTITGTSMQPSATVTVLPSTPLLNLAMVIGYDSYSETEGDALVTIYTATIIDIDGVVHNVPTTQGMYNSNARIGVVSSFAIDNSGSYLFTAPISDTAYNIDNGITSVETGSTTLQGGTNVNLANNTTKFVLVNYMDDPDNDNGRIPDGSVTVYTGRSSVPTFWTLFKTVAVSYNLDGNASSIADTVFIFDDVYADHEFSFVYVVGSWYLGAAGYNMDVILKGKRDVITVRSPDDRNALQAMAGNLWDNITVTSDGVLDFTSAKQLFHDTSAPQPQPSASVSIKNNNGLLELDGVYSGYTVWDDVPVYIITRIDTNEADIVEVTAEDLDEDGFDFAYLDADSNQVVSAIYIIK